MTRAYVVCTVKPWNVEAFRDRTPSLPGSWHLIEDPTNLTYDAINRLSPRYLFFPHWSWKVPRELTECYECVCFHMTDVPYGRGGSPLQNLILRRHTSTMLSALRMADELDAGPVYGKRQLLLAGSAEDIYRRAAGIAYDLIEEIVAREPVPVPQTGEVALFRRRTPDESALPDLGSAAEIYDFIRMLDAPTYPKAFLESGRWRIEFDRASLGGDDEVEARVVIRRIKPP
jgi:methionyl-tRNA formyltransferase